MLDQTQKTVLIDESKSVTDLTANVCEHLGLSNPEEYSLQIEAATAANIDKLDAKAKKAKEKAGEKPSGKFFTVSDKFS
jgi:hypothetical protein